MVTTRSQVDAEEREELRRIEEERQQRATRVPSASPAMPCGEGTSAGPSRLHATITTHEQARSPTRSNRTTNSTLQLRLAELEAAEKLAAIKRQELVIEADLVKKRLAAQIATIEDNESLRGEPALGTEQHRNINDWLVNTTEVRGERREALRPVEPREEQRAQFDRRARSPTPGRSKDSIGMQLAEALEKLARPQRRYNCDLPDFSGSPNEWLPFKAAVRDSTQLYHIPPAENLLRLRNCLKGQARDAVAALLYTATDPDVIMRTLEQSFGRPEVIIDKVLEDLKRISKPGPAATDLNSFAVKVQNAVCILQNLDRRGYLYTPQLAREVIDKLSPHIKSKWCEYAYEHSDSTEPEIVMLSRFLMREADIALRYTYAPTTSTAPAVNREIKNTGTYKKKGAVYNTEALEEIDRCPNCNNAHVLHRCPGYCELNVEQRWNLVREKGLCFKCVKKKHRRFQCKAEVCGVNQCRRPHHSSLHEETTAHTFSRPNAQTSSRPDARIAPKPTTTQDAVVLSVASDSATGLRQVLLKVCPVVVSGPRGEVKTYALLDEGATISLIDKELADEIGADGPTQELHMNGVNMSQRERDSKLVTLHLRGKKENAIFELKARTVRDLRLREQSIPGSLLRHQHLQDLVESEVCFDLARPRILVGADHWEIIVSRQLRIGGSDQPAASRTHLGWVVHGSVPRSVIYSSEGVFHIYAPDRRVSKNELHDQHLHDLVETHFRIDAIGVALKPRVSDADERAMNIFNQTIKKIDGGYEVGLPWRHEKVVMPPSYAAAANRLKSIERKMNTSSEFAKEYSAQIENLLAKGYAIPCDGTEVQSSVSWYLPHFAVENLNKPGKRRLVFDAANRSHGVCLNDQILEGPDLLLSLQGILFRFRERSIAVTADIQEMFLRVKIRPEDQPAQQFLWREDRTEPPRLYKMTSMIFGAASSPFLAHSVRDYNARAHAQSHHRALRAITKSHYMDDLVDSYDTEEEARCTIQELRAVHAVAGFTLRSWSSNKVEILKDVPRDLRATEPTQLGGAGPEHKILGLCWNSKEDELGFNTAMHRVPNEVRSQSRAPTKREALSAVMSIYDPLGLLSCYTIRAKIILQSLWRLQIAWDEPIPADEAEEFAAWIRQLSEITRLRLRRSYTLEGYNCYKTVELHVMCDASEQAYATVAYWRVTHQNESVSVSLVAAKAKVAPRRSQSIPRLELQAAVIGARLADTIKREHRIEVQRTVYWTDSSTVVHWITNDARRYTPFVAHRLGEITELTHRDEWRWLPTEHNVADDATRLRRTPIIADDRWFKGPNFLLNQEEEWPSGKVYVEEHEVLHTNERKEQHEWMPDPTRFSRFEKLVRATARVLAFIDICRRRATRMEIEHIERAEKAILRRAQEDSFGTEMQKIEIARPIPRTSRLYKLDPVLEDGLLRVRGRIAASSAPAEMKRPIILDGRHLVTKLIVMREHCAAGHANRERVTNDLRQRYWVIHLRPTVRAVEHRCTLCRVRKARPKVPTTGDLPHARLDPFHRPFSNCGVDYFGPMTVKVGRRREKRWGALYTCLTTRAVHLELVSSLSTDSALMALRRMAARRGWPSRMYSDNATAFRGADQELKNAYAEWTPVLRDEGLLHRMKWLFIPPGAPNQGGAWERLVRSVKTALAATLREKAPPEEVLYTLLTEAEYSINARPLTHVSVSADDLEALTPNHFLLGSSTGLPTTGPCKEADRRTWRASQALADSFWQRWLREYLPTLVPRGKPTDHGRGLRVGDIVVVVDRTLPRNVWPMGVVERTYPGPDGGTRVVDVKTKTGVFRRPASKLAVLVKEEEAAQVTPGGEM